MKVRKSLCVALLLPAACLAAAAGVTDKTSKPQELEITNKDKINKDDISAMNKQIEAGLAAKDNIVAVPAVRATQPAKPYHGTEAAPVDGLDGKPHAGPFVDLTPEQTALAKGAKEAMAAAATAVAAKSLPTSLAKLKTSEGIMGAIPEKNDGVMDDTGRPLPKPGTTGTEGGVSEKEKSKGKAGLLAEEKNTPQEPKALPPLPHSEQERMREQAEKQGIKLVKDDEASASKSGKSAGSMGIEKPDNLPEKTHDTPLPDGARSSTSGRGKLVDTLPYTEGEKPRQRAGSSRISSGEGAVVGGDDSFQEWFHSFVVSLTMIIFTEIGDKTFLVAALMAMRHDRLVVFTAALSALIAMTVLSAVLGHIAPTLLPKRFTTLAAALLFLVFGIRMLREGLAMAKTAGVGEEMREVEAELEEKEHSISKGTSGNDGAAHLLEAGRPGEAAGAASKYSVAGLTNLLSLVLSPAWVQTFIMTFLGEWGDRSQIATIAMAAGQDYWWVTLGAILGHALCTGLAVVGGRALAGKVSMRVVTIGGAVAFLFFGLLYLVEAYYGI